MLLAIDLSTSKTGFAIFNLQTEELVEAGVCYPDLKKTKGVYPKASLLRMRSMADDLRSILTQYEFTHIIIEEVISSKMSGVISQKVLDGGHFILLDRIFDWIDLVQYEKPSWWRSALGLKLSPKDSEVNRLVKTKQTKVAKITAKDLAVRYVREHYPNFEINRADHDVCDAICIGAAFLKEKRHLK